MTQQYALCTQGTCSISERWFGAHRARPYSRWRSVVCSAKHNGTLRQGHGGGQQQYEDGGGVRWCRYVVVLRLGQTIQSGQYGRRLTVWVCSSHCSCSEQTGGHSVSMIAATPAPSNRRIKDVKNPGEPRKCQPTTLSFAS